MKGQIIKISGGTFFVYAENKVYNCFSRGQIKYKNGKLIVGDYVEFEKDIITSVEPRKSVFNRPNIANVDCINVVVSSPPQPDYLLIDKIIARAVFAGVDAVITVNKSDLTDNTFDYVAKNYLKAVKRIFKVSALSGEGIDELKEFLSGKFCAFAGQSAVGKTSILNYIFEKSNRVGEISEKSGRGKHTTTSSEIFLGGDLKIIDTPGFADFDCDIKSFELARYYPEFTAVSDTCYYKGCVHINEPDCAVKIELESGNISLDRYNRYKEIYKSLLENEKYERY